MTVGSQESIIHCNGVISQCVDDMSSMKLKNDDVQGDEKYFSTSHFR
jgi:hypothetical protein